jgi:UTP-glucose-1-phosphate uridylyltransferase
MDYSLHDAVNAGFSNVVFVIRRDMEAQFRAHTGHALGRKVSVQYVCQDISMVPQGFSPPSNRAKPWGTAHAILSCRSAVNEPFAVINADDFYGRESYKVLAQYLDNLTVTESRYCMVGFALRNTLSEHGPVSRAICEVDADGFLREIVERTRIQKVGSSISVTTDDGMAGTLTGNEPVSLNMWGFTPAVFDGLEHEFTGFMRVSACDVKAEFYIPTAVGNLIRSGKAKVSVLSTGAKWFGITYPEDKGVVTGSIAQLVRTGAYPENARF